MTNAKLNRALSALALRPAMMGHWTVEGDDWKNFEKGVKQAYRRIRIGRRDYWVGVSVGFVDGLAAMFAWGLFGAMRAGEPFLHFTVYSVDPLTDTNHLKHSENIGSAGLGKLRPAIKRLRTEEAKVV